MGYNKLVAALILVFVACASCSKEQQTSYLPIEGEIEVHLDSIISQPPLNAMSMVATKDFLVVANAGRDSIIDIYTLPSGEFIGSGVVAGEGPGEIVRPDIRTLAVINENIINIQTGKPGVSADISLPNLKVTAKSYTLPSQWDFAQAIVPVDNGYIMQEGSLPNNWALTDNTGNIKTVFHTEIPKSIAEKTSGNEFAQILAKTSVGLYSKEAGRMAICYKMFPEIHLFDINGEKKNILKNDSPWTGDALWIVGAQSTSGAIYINIHNPSDKDFSESSIIVIDWNGNVKSCYKVPKAVGAFCVAENIRTIFFTGYHESDYIFKFDI